MDEIIGCILILVCFFGSLKFVKSDELDEDN